VERIVLIQSELDDLLEYSCSLPTGTTIGKRWKKNVNAYQHPHNPVPDWRMGEYIEDEDPEMVGIIWRRVVLLVPYQPGRFEGWLAKVGLIQIPKMVEKA